MKVGNQKTRFTLAAAVAAIKACYAVHALPMAAKTCKFEDCLHLRTDCSKVPQETQTQGILPPEGA